MRVFFFKLSLTCLLLSAAFVHGQKPMQVASVEGVTEYRFGNGARVLLFPDPSRPTITVNMTVLVGSRHEGYGEAGMAHLLEHMVFKGTPTFPDVPKALRDHGANFNGTTNSDRTNYFETLPANDENLDFAIHLECDRLVNSFVRREDLISEFTVVRNEFERGENSPGGVLAQRVQAVAFEWHNYGKSTIGNRSDIERVPIDNLQEFYRKYYQPDNCVLIVTGAFDAEKALSLAGKYLGSIPKPTRRLDATYTEEPPQDGERTVTLRRVGKVGSIVAAYHMPASSHEDWAPLRVLGSVLSESKIGRLDAALVETKMATNASASADDSHDPGLFFLSAEPGEASLEVVREKLLSVMDNLTKEPFTDEEVNRAKIRYQRTYESTLSSAASMSQALSSSAALGDWRLFFLKRDRTAAVTAADLNRVAGLYFAPYNRTVGTFIPSDAPQRATIPQVPSIPDVVKDYKGGAVAAAGEAFEPSPENIDARTKTIEHEGLKIAMLPKKNRGERVSMVMTLRYGNEESLAGHMTASRILGAMLMSGTKTMNRQVLQERLDAIGVRLFPGSMAGGRGRGGRGGGGGGVGQLSFSMDAKNDSLVQGIQLLGEILRDPGFPQDEFDQMKLRAITGLSNSLTEPDALAGDKLGRALSQYPPSDPRFVPTTAENIKEMESLTLDQVIAIYKNQLSSSVGEISIVGDFDPDQAVTAIKEILKDWKSPVPYRTVEREALQNLAGSKENIVTPDKANAVFLAGLTFPMNDEDPESTALQIGNFILGGGTLSSRLGNRIRQKEGLSYGVNSSLSTPSRGNDSRFTINAITNPANIDAVEKAAFEELKKFIDEGPTEQELADAQKAFLEAQKVGRTTDGAIAGQIVSNLHLGRSFAFIAEREKQVKALTPSAVKGAFKKHINPDKLVVVRAGDIK
jgi:zinc protease